MRPYSASKRCAKLVIALTILSLWNLFGDVKVSLNFDKPVLPVLVMSLTQESHSSSSTLFI